MSRAMKLMGAVVVAGAVLMGPALASTNTVALGTAGIKNSYHDFSNDSWNTANHTLCGVCHSMHNATIGASIPLWSHATAVSGSFTPYTSPTMSQTIGTPTGITLACLSCHDGVTAINAYNGTTNGTPTKIASTSIGYVGTDLRGSHPVSFNYVTSASANNLIRPATAVADATVPGFGSGTIAQKMLIGGTQLECSSCHDIHRQKGDSMNNTAYTVANSANGQLCLICHIK